MSTIITKKQFPNNHIYKTETAPAVPCPWRSARWPSWPTPPPWSRYGETTVLVAVTASAPSPRRHRLLPPVRGL